MNLFSPYKTYRFCTKSSNCVITKILPRGFEFLKNISFIKKIVEKSQNEGLFKSIQKNKSS